MTDQTIQELTSKVPGLPMNLSTSRAKYSASNKTPSKTISSTPIEAIQLYALFGFLYVNAAEHYMYFPGGINIIYTPLSSGVPGVDGSTRSTPSSGKC